MLKLLTLCGNSGYKAVAVQSLRCICADLASACHRQISEAELEAIARGGTLPELDEAEAGGTEASRRLLGKYETPQR
jgi:hypothetical protein